MLLVWNLASPVSYLDKLRYGQAKRTHGAIFMHVHPPKMEGAQA